MWGSGQKCRKNDRHPFFGSKIMNLLVFLEKFFRVSTPWGLYGAEWEELVVTLTPCKLITLSNNRILQ